MTFSRASGVLLHPTCLPGPYGIGDLGPAAHAYLEWLARAGAAWWQVLPLNPAGPGASPYTATSTFAGNPALVSPELLRAEGLLEAERPRRRAGVLTVRGRVRPRSPVQAGAARARVRALRLPASGRHRRSLRGVLCRERCLAARLGAVRGDQACPAAGRPGGSGRRSWRCAGRRRLASVAHRARARASVRGVLPVPVLLAVAGAARTRRGRSASASSATCRSTSPATAPRCGPTASCSGSTRAAGRWLVAGVPPDYFSATGQLWGNPLYDWEAVEASGYAWWIERLRATLELVDAVRLDHFRGFAAYWEVPAGEKTAVKGRWVPGPGRRLFDAVAGGARRPAARRRGPRRRSRRTSPRCATRSGCPAWRCCSSRSPRRRAACSCRTGSGATRSSTRAPTTTTRRWAGTSRTRSPEEKDFVRRYLGTDGHEIHWDMIRLALSIGGRPGGRAAPGHRRPRRRLPHEHAVHGRGKLAVPAHRLDARRPPSRTGSRTSPGFTAGRRSPPDKGGRVAKRPPGLRGLRSQRPTTLRTGVAVARRR